MEHRRVVVSESDFASLNSLIDALRLSFSGDFGCLHVLATDLQDAQVLKRHQMPTNVVRMNSQVHVIDLGSGEDTVYTLVFPQHEDVERRRVSVLDPFGSALLGSRVGQVITPTTQGGRRRLRVGAIVYQQDVAPAA